MLRLPQGVRFGSSIVQRFVTKLLLRHGLQDTCQVFVDNAFICGRDKEEYMASLTKFFEVFSKAGFKLKWDKSVHFVTKKFKFLFGF